MADEKISAMTSASALSGTELIAGVQGGVNVSMTPAQLKTYAVGAVPAFYYLSSAVSPAVPGSISTTTMMGLGTNGTGGLSAVLTPTISGVVQVIFTGNMVNVATTTAGAGVTVQITWGTGAAPANGATLTGTQVGALCTARMPNTGVANDWSAPFSVIAIISGLSVGTTYWFDLTHLADVGTGPGTSRNSVSLVELT